MSWDSTWGWAVGCQTTATKGKYVSYMVRMKLIKAMKGKGQSEQGERCWECWWEMDGNFKYRLIGKVTFVQEVEGANLPNIWKAGRGHSPGRGNSPCEIAKAGARLTCLRSSKGASVPGPKQTKRRKGIRRWSQDIIGIRLCVNFSFIIQVLRRKLLWSDLCFCFNFF